MQLIDNEHTLESILNSLDGIFLFGIKQKGIYICIEKETVSMLYYFNKNGQRKLMGKWMGQMYPEGIFNEKKAIIKVSNIEGVALLKLNGKQTVITGYYLDIKNIRKKDNDVLFEGLVHEEGDYIWKKERLRY